MSNLPTAFGCTVTKKIDRMFIQELQIGMLINNIGGRVKVLSNPLWRTPPIHPH